MHKSFIDWLGEDRGRFATGNEKAWHMSSFIRQMVSDRFLLRIVAVAAIGGFLFGYDTGVIGGALLFIKTALHAQSNLAQQSIVASLLVGAIVGALAGGWLAGAFDRRRTLIAAGWIYVVGGLASAFSQELWQLVGARLVLGFAVGAASFIAPMYISELTPKQIRGGTVTFNQLMLTCGIFAAYIANWALQGVPDNWRWMVGIAAVPGLALAIGMYFAPSSPRWLVEKGRHDEAAPILRRIYKKQDVDAELREIESASQQESGYRGLLQPAVRPMVIIGVGLAAFQQLVGVNTVIYYAPTILSFAGANAGSALTQALSIGITNVIFTLAALLLVDRVGRRPLLIAGLSGLVVALIVLGVFFHFGWLHTHLPWIGLVALLVYIAAFAIGIGPVFWLMISEIYPTSVRGPAESLASVVNWSMNFVVSFTFLTLVSAISRAGTFWLYAVLGIAGIVFAFARVPETRGRSLEQIQQQLDVRADS
jgi:sugar porter (SP) family MFS transporter